MTIAPDSVPAVALRDLSKRFGSLHAVKGISLEVHQGEVFGFLGLNGAGKTTTIRILLDLLRPTGGRAQLFGHDCQKESRRTRSLLGYSPGELGIYPDMTGEELLRFTERLGGVPVSAEYRSRLLDRLELPDADLHRPLREYSMGMKRKLGLVQALQGDPPLLVLDEPTEGLDPLVQEALHEILFELRRRGRTIFMSSHVLSEVERLCDRIAVIRKGEIVLLSTVSEARSLGGRVVRVFFREPVASPALPAGMTLVDAQPDRWTVRIPGEAAELLARIAGMPVRDLQISEPALEDVLRNFYREEKS